MLGAEAAGFAVATCIAGSVRAEFADIILSLIVGRCCGGRLPVLFIVGIIHEIFVDVFLNHLRKSNLWLFFILILIRITIIISSISTICGWITTSALIIHRLTQSHLYLNQFINN